ncbi:MAG: glycoside hydrolase family 9 protein [Bacteroidota bacterium]
MKKFGLLVFFIISYSCLFAQNSWIRINQLGYLNNSIKNAVLLSKDNISVRSFDICDALTGQTVRTISKVRNSGKYGSFTASYRLDFSAFSVPGTYFLKTGNIKSPAFRIGNDVYDNTADFLLKYMRQQQCGYNPFLKDSCHKHDGFVIYNKEMEGRHIDATGGWHDATDYLQYVTTSANAVYQLLFAYQQNPDAFGDQYDKDGNPGKNGIPDILDQAKWGLDWLVKMNPENEIMFNQIADDRDHAGFRLPNLDSVSYGKGLERPVYFCTGEVQGLFKYKNMATGIASTAGKFSSAFALGAELLKKYYPEFSEKINKKAVEAYNYGKKHPGACQTAPCKSPYYYEEDNYVDDMELAAVQLFRKTNDKNYLKDAAGFGEKEPVTPWMGADTADHYQWYPFLNLGHYYMSDTRDKSIKNKFTGFFKQGIENVFEKGKSNPFLIGIPFIWCSNNLVAAMLTQCRLYNEVTGDKKYLEMEAALRDWLFGCNPWGTSMIIGLPENGDSPSDPHSSLWVLKKYPIKGGLVDGPVYGSIFRKLEGLRLDQPDEYAEFQSSRVVYHDDFGDYSTNEPTMDGTASLTYYLSSMQTMGQKAVKTGKDGKKSLIEKKKTNEEYLGAIVRTDPSEKMIHLVFTGHEFADGGTTIINVLKKHNIKASFFFTGDFYRNPKFASVIYDLKKNGHYLGAHSDKHVLYNDWTKRDSTLVTKEQYLTDVRDNYKEMEKFGVKKEQARYFLPAYEWYNQQIADWTAEAGLKLVNFTPGTYSNADWTIPELKGQYKSSDEIYSRILEFEKNSDKGLNGFILLTHFGTDPRRTDKFYNKLDALIGELKRRGYKFGLIE